MYIQNTHPLDANAAAVVEKSTPSRLYTFRMRALPLPESLTLFLDAHGDEIAELLAHSECVLLLGWLVGWLFVCLSLLLLLLLCYCIVCRSLCVSVL